MAVADTEQRTVQTAPKIRISDHRCRNCGRLLFRAHIPQNVAGLRIEMRCRCSWLTVIESETTKPLDTQSAL